jgi:hypothetical protein
MYSHSATHTLPNILSLLSVYLSRYLCLYLLRRFPPYMRCRCFMLNIHSSRLPLLEPSRPFLLSPPTFHPLPTCVGQMQARPHPVAARRPTPQTPRRHDSPMARASRRRSGASRVRRVADFLRRRAHAFCGGRGAESADFCAARGRVRLRVAQIFGASETRACRVRADYGGETRTCAAQVSAAVGGGRAIEVWVWVGWRAMIF